MAASGVDDQNNDEMISLQKTGFDLIVKGRSLYELYEPRNEISRGSYGVVSRARDVETGEMVALKHEIKGLTDSTLKEHGLLASVPPHPSIVRFKRLIHDAAAGVYVAMEYLEYDLKRYMAVQRQPFTVDQVKKHIHQILLGVEYLYEMGVIHRDIKPSNILIDTSMAQPKICDFGLSHVSGVPQKKEGYTRGVGTLWYTAPETLLGSDKYPCAVDMWSVGCTMAELLLNEVFFKGDIKMMSGWSDKALWSDKDEKPWSDKDETTHTNNLVDKDEKPWSDKDETTHTNNLVSGDILTDSRIQSVIIYAK